MLDGNLDSTMIDGQYELEKMFSKYQLIECLTQAFRDADFSAALLEDAIPEDFGLSMLVQMALHKRADVSVLVGLHKRYFDSQPGPHQACADMILVMLEKAYFEWDPDSEKVVVEYEISSDLQLMIDRYQYPMPMVVEPNEVKGNRDTGYLTIKGSLLLRNNHHDGDICLDHINRMNQVPLALNTTVVAFVQNKWKNLDHRKADETQDDFEKRVRAFEKYDTTSRDVIDALLSYSDTFWLTHKYDKRGRTYCQGYHVNYQSNDWCKAVVEFAEPEHLNKE